MKQELRIPTADPYAYIGIELLDNEVLTDEKLQEVVENHRRATRQIKGSGGLSEKDFNEFIDNQLSGKGVSVEQYEKMNDYQIFAVQVIKRAKKRNGYAEAIGSIKTTNKDVKSI